MYILVSFRVFSLCLCSIKALRALLLSDALSHMLRAVRTRCAGPPILSKQLAEAC